MEALRTQNDNLRWEVNRLDAENRKLRSGNPDAGERVDLEAELEQTKRDVATLTEQVRVYQRQLEELKTSAGTEAGEAAEPQQSARELEQAREELQAANSRAATEQQRAVELQQTMSQLEAELEDVQRKCHELEKELLGHRETSRRELEAAMRDAELDRYRALDAERSKWEAREERTLQQLETARRELDKISTDRHGVGSDMYISMETEGEKVETMEEQLQGAREQLESQKSDRPITR